MYIMRQVKEKFATQVNAATLSKVRVLAKSEGRQIQDLVDEALTDLIEKRKSARPRAHVMATYLASHEKYSDLHSKLSN